MGVARTIKHRKPATRLFLISLLFPLLHFCFPFLHQLVRQARYAEDYYLFYPYARSFLLLLQLVFVLTGLVSAIRIYVFRNEFARPGLAVFSCMLRVYPFVYLLLMMALLRFVPGR